MRPPATTAAAGRAGRRTRIPLDPDARFFVAAPLLAGALLAGAAVASGGTLLYASAAVLVLAAGFSAFFFRDPERAPAEGEPSVLSPADGRVTHAAADEAGRIRVSIFLSLFDVHVNRAPVAGAVADLRYRPGAFRAAFRPDAADRNEQNELALAAAEGTVLVRQIVGVLARRIVCRVRPGDRLERGERFGLMRFGSRTDVVLPPGFQLAIGPGDRVRGGETVIARPSAVPERRPTEGRLPDRRSPDRHLPERRSPDRHRAR